MLHLRSSLAAASLTGFLNILPKWVHLFEHVADVALDGAHVAYDNAPSSLRFALFEIGSDVHNA